MKTRPADAQEYFQRRLAEAQSGSGLHSTAWAIWYHAMRHQSEMRAAFGFRIVDGLNYLLHSDAELGQAFAEQNIDFTRHSPGIPPIPAYCSIYYHRRKAIADGACYPL
ncbi:hypothetical protein KCP69_11820 [Salmonella enterica subsp. enterica]|nr:hypothetical protein KCP69_11820 [Salmonella enterica subsp. enterica]